MIIDSPHMSGEEEVQARVVFRGRVQGVYFRAHCEERAILLGIRGWVANREDGSVEGLFQGRRRDIEDLIDYCRQGQPYARVSECEVMWKECTERYTRFEITG